MYYKKYKIGYNSKTQLFEAFNVRNYNFFKAPTIAEIRKKINEVEK